VDFFHQIPTDIEIVGNVFDCAISQQFQGSKSEGLGVALVAFHEVQPGPKEVSAILAAESVHDELKQATFAAQRRQMKMPLYPPLENDIFAIAV